MRISDWSSDVCSSDLIPEHIIWAEVEGEFGVYPEACERTHGHDHTLGHTCGPGRINLDERRISADSSGRMVGAAGRDQVMEAKVPRLGASGAEYPPRSEEHTSELQSLMRNSYAAFCLKKKQNQNTLRD